jgi:hypothetical protein
MIEDRAADGCLCVSQTAGDPVPCRGEVLAWAQRLLREPGLPREVEAEVREACRAFR